MNGKQTIRLHYESSGSGPAIVMLHGWGANIFAWHRLVTPLASRFRTIAIDLKGFGASPKPDDGAYSIFDQADRVLDLIRDLELDSFVLAGHSYGGAVSLAVALHPARTQSIKGLILIGAASYPQDMPPALKIMQTPVLAHIGLNMLGPEYQVRAMLGQLVLDKQIITDEMVTQYARPLNDPLARKALTETLRQMRPPDIDRFCERYRQIDCPALLIWGREDRIVPLEIGEKLAAALPISSLNVLERCGHIPQEEKPTEVLSLISRFLDSLSLNP